jgi:general secretion pathway protein I
MAVKTAGFTLLEVMVSVTIIGIALVTLIGSQSQSISLAGISRFETTAALLARQKLPELINGGFADLASSDGDFGDAYSMFRWQVEVSELGEDETGITAAPDLLRRIRLIVTTPDDEDMRFVLERIVMAGPGELPES